MPPCTNRTIERSCRPVRPRRHIVHQLTVGVVGEDRKPLAEPSLHTRGHGVIFRPCQAAVPGPAHGRRRDIGAAATPSAACVPVMVVSSVCPAVRRRHGRLAGGGAAGARAAPWIGCDRVCGEQVRGCRRSRDSQTMLPGQFSLHVQGPVLWRGMRSSPTRR